MDKFENGHLDKAKKNLEKSGEVKKVIVPKDLESDIASFTFNKIEEDVTLNDEQKNAIRQCALFLQSPTIIDSFENTPDGHEKRTEFENKLSPDLQDVYDSNRLRANNTTGILGIVKNGLLDWFIKDNALLEDKLKILSSIERRTRAEYRDMILEDKMEYQNHVRDLAESICAEYLAHAYHKKSA